MKQNASLLTAVAVAAALIVGPTLADDNPSSSIDPGFVPNTGQFNPGHAAEPWSTAPPTAQAQRPTQAQARAALMIPDPNTVSAGADAAQNGGQETTGTVAVTGGAPGPIGATMQTMPAKFSARNDLLDHVPIMAWPLRLDAQQRQQIYQAVMADQSQPAQAADTLKPASSLPYEQIENMHALPQQLSGIEALRGLAYVKTKDKVLLVRPPNRIVVDEITM
jgi:hypothetical protein